MSISSRQVTKALNTIVEDGMKEGFIPTVEYVTSKLGEFYATHSVGYPFFRNNKLSYRKVFDVDVYNDNLTQLYDDLNNLYEELVDQFTVVLKDFDYYDTERRKLLHEISSLEDQLTDLVLTASDTEGYVYSVHDSFIDRSKIDMEHTSCEINTDAGIVTLRESQSGIAKIDMSHYFDKVNWPILAEAKYTANILSNTLFPQSKFGYAFSDVSASWTQEIITNTPGELVVSFIIDISPNDPDGLYITRIEVKGQSSKVMYVTPLYSLDNINFVTLPLGYGVQAKEVSNGKIAVWNFDETRVRYLKFSVQKLIEDEQTTLDGNPAYRYVIGFKHIVIFKMGYDTSSVLYSTAYTISDPGGESLTIDKASLVVDQDVQLGNKINYYLSLGDPSTDDPTLYNWAVISPVNDPAPTEQQVVDFKHIAFFNNVPEIEWDSVSYGTPLENYYGINFYKIYQFPYEPVKNTVTLYRGKDNWQVTPTYTVQRRSIYDEKYVFGNSSTITLTYPNFTPVDGEGLIRGSVRVKSDAGQNPSYWATTPGDYTVNYSTKVITRQTGGNISSDPLAPSNTVYIDYQYDNEISEPTVYTTQVYILNSDGIDINHVRFNQAELDAGQYTIITTNGVDLDISSVDRVRLTAGWHKITTTAEPESANDRFYSVNGNKYLYQLVYAQFAYAEKLQETSWFELKYNTLITDHLKYAIVDYDGDGNKEIIVNYRPQTSKWANANDDMLCAHGAETYVLSYKFITTATNKIYLKAVFTREDNSSPTSTATLRSYTIKLGY